MIDEERIKEDVECDVNGYARNICERADEDYITARLCYFHGLTGNFLWNGQQCIEKYLKAIALFQDIDVRKQKHNLRKLFAKVDNHLNMKSAETMFPRKIEGIASKQENFEEFLERLTFLGMNRYCSHSWCLYGDELIKLDAAVFIIRRYCTPIGAVLGKRGRPVKDKIKNCIDEGRDFTTHGFLGEVIHKDKHAEKRNYLLAGNSFFPVKKDIEVQFHTSKSFNHVLGRRYEAAINGNEHNKHVFIGLAKKLLKRLYFERSIESELLDDIAKVEKSLAQEAVSA